LIEKDKGARLGGLGDEGELIPMLPSRGISSLGQEGGVEAVSQSSLDAMIAPYRCSDYDPYKEEDGETPMGVTAITVALFMKLPKDLAMKLSMREFTMGRLFLMFAQKNPVHPVLVKFVSLFDLFYVESLDLSISSASYPIEMYSGTVIESGLSFDITNLEFFGIINIARAYFHITMSPFVVECHIYIDPFAFKIGDFVLLEVKGLEGDSRRETQMKKAAEERERAEREEQARIDAMNKEKAKKCDKQPCWTCAKASGGNPIELLCAGDNVVSDVVSALYTTTESTPIWTPGTAPGLCEPTKTPINADDAVRVPPADTKKVLLDECDGEKECVLTPSDMLFGTAPGSAGKDMTLMAVVRCVSIARAAKERGERAMKRLDVPCADGCFSCDQVVAELPEAELEVGCGKEGVIFEVTDASYGATLQQPKFSFSEADTTCEQKRIPKGDMCQIDPAKFKRFIEDKCVGRQSCTVSAANVTHEFGSGHCENAVMQLTAIVKCKRRQLPFKADDMPKSGKFGLIHYEERVWGMHNNGVALSNPFFMRVAFQQSALGLDSNEVEGFDKLDWSSKDRLRTAKVRRLLATMVVPKGEGAVSHGFWKFKIDGDVKKFSSMGGMLSIMDGSMSQEFCHHCDLKTCGSKRNPECEFSVHIEGNAKYVVALYGVSDKHPKEPKISLLYKPPRGCKQVVDCEEPDDPCTRVPLKDMPWFAIKGEGMPWFECKMNFAANVLRMEADVRPFCSAVGAFVVIQLFPSTVS
jgi:hypothetical protein